MMRQHEFSHSMPSVCVRCGAPDSPIAGRCPGAPCEDMNKPDAKDEHPIANLLRAMKAELRKLVDGLRDAGEAAKAAADRAAFRAWADVAEALLARAEEKPLSTLAGGADAPCCPRCGFSGAEQAARQRLGFKVYFDFVSYFWVCARYDGVTSQADSPQGALAACLDAIDLLDRCRDRAEGKEPT